MTISRRHIPNAYTSTDSSYISSYISGAINSGVPITLLACDLFFRVASPKSPIFTLPVVPVMKMLSHFRSRWMTGGLRVCRKWRPLRI